MKEGQVSHEPTDVALVAKLELSGLIGRSLHGLHVEVQAHLLELSRRGQFQRRLEKLVGEGPSLIHALSEEPQAQGVEVLLGVDVRNVQDRPTVQPA